MLKIYRFVFFVSLFLVTTFAVQAQQDWDYEWEQHHISFTLAEDFKTVTNTADEYTAKGDGIEFTIFPFADETIDATDIIAYTTAVGKLLKLEQLDDADVLKLNGLDGAYIEGYKEGDRIILVGFIDPLSATNFFALITFGDNDAVAEDEAVRMLKSIRKK